MRGQSISAFAEIDIVSNSRSAKSRPGCRRPSRAALRPPQGDGSLAGLAEIRRAPLQESVDAFARCCRAGAHAERAIADFERGVEALRRRGFDDGAFQNPGHLHAELLAVEGD